MKTKTEKLTFKPQKNNNENPQASMTWGNNYSTVTDFAKFLGLSMSHPLKFATW